MNRTEFIQKSSNTNRTIKEASQSCGR